MRFSILHINFSEVSQKSSIFKLSFIEGEYIFIDSGMETVLEKVGQAVRIS